MRNAGDNATTMFARFRPSPYRLQVSIVETRRVGGKVRHQHIASLGSIETPLTVANRICLLARGGRTPRQAVEPDRSAVEASYAAISALTAARCRLRRQA